MFDTYVIIGIPSAGDWKSEFATSFLAMCAYSARHLPNIKFEVQCAEGSILLQNRYKIAAWALERRATHVLWLDDDMTFPVNTLAKLLNHKTPIVGCNYTTRKFPCYPLGAKEGKRLLSVGHRGLEEVDHLPMGVMLTHTSVFTKTPEPWFLFGWSPKDKEFVGEDVWFCREARKKGFAVLVDHDLSLQVGHVGQVEFGHEMTGT